ncbi:SCP2 sterol-binding domain-containing protein [Micromonospora zhanjiangensis]|uniref:SCP2 sterol-binding domain-containing protein n=1 Tax=Micromonospora zhanjiangensis TaxID=1522057 RepID=A0ABV8KGU6_9ACTN
MNDTTGEFFDRLSRWGNVPRLKKTTGTVRFDITDGERSNHWLVTIDKGDVRVSQEHVDANAVIRIEPAVMDRIALGEVKPLAAWLRNDLLLEGQLRFLVLLERLLPGPPGSRHPRDVPRTAPPNRRDRELVRSQGRPR